MPLLSLVLYFVLFDAPLQVNISNNDKSEAFSFMIFNAKAFGSINNNRNLTAAKKISSFVKHENPDFICFQEFSRFEFDTFAYYPYKFIGYRPNFKKTLLVIYSQYPIVDKGYVDFPETRNQAIYADINIGDEIIRVYNIHLESYKLVVDESHLNLSGLRFVSHKVNLAQSKQEEQVQLIVNHTKTFKGKIIFAGDFNSTQYSTNYKILSKNKQDSFIESGFGFGATYPRINYPFRIDNVLADEGIEFLSHQNYDIKLSDHEPVMVKMHID